MFLMCAGGKHPPNVAGEHVNLYIQLLSVGEFTKRRVLRGVRNNVDREMRAPVLSVAHIVYSQRYAVERDRAFWSNRRSELLRDSDPDSRRIAVGAGANDGRHRIDMAGDDMPAELVAEAKRALEVKGAPSRQRFAAVLETVSPETSTANQSSPLSTTVRHTPEQEMEAPRSTVSRS